jgi:predicted nucleotidyltransferase
MSNQQYTPYVDVNQILGILHKNAKEILKEQFIGMYLYGSLSTGDFNPKSSDIDFLVVTESSLPDNTISKLESMHKKIWDNGLKWAAKLEGAYIPKELIRRHDPNGHPCPTVNEGRFYVDRHGSDWIIQRHVIREYGVVLEGPDPKSLIDPVSPEEIRQSVLGILEEWWFPMLENPIWLSENRGEYHAFAVLTMCRALHALQHGTIVSKPIAANWAKDEFRHWSPLIEMALASQHDAKNGFLDKTLEFIQFVKQTTKEWSLL